ncbi:hypothetical protein D3C87_1226450 [compost metagenome]
MTRIYDGDELPAESSYAEACRLLEESIQSIGHNLTQVRSALGPVLAPEAPFDGMEAAGKTQAREDSELITWIRQMAAAVRLENERLSELRARIQL